VCGIAGRFNFSSGAPVDPHVIRAMCDLLAHRGPDGQGVYTDGAVGLGHRRLAIIDLSSAAAQPMATDDGSLRVVFNGEIYNFLEIRAELEQRGHRFRSRSDTEVILAAYREYGLDFVARLRGMFAMALWDAPASRLLLVRDRIGKKPLHYRIDRDGIAFASEPKAFLAEPTFEATPNLEAIWHYLSFQYVPSPLSAFAGVQKLRPGHYLLVEAGRVTTERYWRIRYAQKRALTDEEACDELRHRLTECVRLRLISDVPLGAFLSGGIDSGTIVALMAQLGSGRVKTFSIGFEQKEYDELPYARMVAERYGTEHHEFVVRPDAVAIVPKLAWHYNEPYADSSAIPTYYLAEMTRRHVTVALNGDAGDENFAGYDRYLANMLSGHFDRLPRVVRMALQRSARVLPHAGTRTMVSRARRFLESATDSRERRYATWIMHFADSFKAEVCTPEFLEAASHARSTAWVESAFAESDAPDFVDATLDVDVNLYLPEDLLVKVDIATMAHALEGRSPLLDHTFMEFAASLPARMKLRRATKKYILKRAVRDLLPAAIIDRPKMGFGVPLDHWFRDELKQMAHDLLLGSSFTSRGYVRRQAVVRLLDDHVQGRANWQYQLWNLLMLEMWHQIFVDQRRSGAPTALSDTPNGARRDTCVAGSAP
jgi:asparagine synthase (glutamine-hydrolysing)